MIFNFAAFDVIDYVNARFILPSLQTCLKHQPIVYCDIDIICTAPLTRLLAIALRGSAIFTRFEGAIDLVHYGNDMTKRDRHPRLQKTLGFNSGVLAFRSAATARLPFAAVLSSLNNHLRKGLPRSSTEAYDQPVANYVFNAIAKFDVEALVNHVHPCPPQLDDVMDAPGLIHFYGGVGASHKIVRMERFLAKIIRQDSATAGGVTINGSR